MVTSIGLKSVVFQLPRVSFMLCKEPIPYVMDFTAHQNSFGLKIALPAPHACWQERILLCGVPAMVCVIEQVVLQRRFQDALYLPCLSSPLDV